MSKETYAYKCPHCSWLWGTEEDAVMCCASQVESATAWLCTLRCKPLHATKEEADKCDSLTFFKSDIK